MKLSKELTTSILNALYFPERSEVDGRRANSSGKKKNGRHAERAIGKKKQAGPEDLKNTPA